MSTESPHASFKDPSLKLVSPGIFVFQMKSIVAQVPTAGLIHEELVKLERKGAVAVAGTKPEGVGLSRIFLADPQAVKEATAKKTKFRSLLIEALKDFEDPDMQSWIQVRTVFIRVNSNGTIVSQEKDSSTIRLNHDDDRASLHHIQGQIDTPHGWLFGSVYLQLNVGLQTYIDSIFSANL